MAHYAFLDENNIVTEVIVGRNETEWVDEINDWEEYYSEVRGQVCKRTSYNTHGNINKATGLTGFRYNFAGIGFTFDPTIMPDGAFIGPKPHPSWILDETTLIWGPPTPKPEDDKNYYWSEQSISWLEI
jgi:hypothetical protein